MPSVSTRHKNLSLCQCYRAQSTVTLSTTLHNKLTSSTRMRSLQLLIACRARSRPRIIIYNVLPFTANKKRKKDVYYGRGIRGSTPRPHIARAPTGGWARLAPNPGYFKHPYFIYHSARDTSAQRRNA